MAIPDGPGPETRIPGVGDLVRVCALLNEAGARYMVIGGMAMIYHGYTRTTEDIDLLVDPSPENIQKVKAALQELPDGAAREVRDQDVLDYTVVRVADEFVVDLMGTACGVGYDQASCHIEHAQIQGVSVPFMDGETLLMTKQGWRPKDQQDALFLQEKLRRKR